MKNLFISIVCLVFFLASCSMNMTSNRAESNPVDASVENAIVTALDYREPSQSPPNNLDPKKVPQLVILGFDDNQFHDGMINVLGVFNNKTNPAGSGQAATFDGSPVTVSFFNNPGGRSTTEEWTVGPETIAQWQAAHLAGHETGNHTYYHEHGLQFTTARWVEEMTRCNEFLATQCGIPSSDIVGFRTPFLEYNLNTYYAMQQVGLIYDCSFEGGWRYWPAEDGSTLFWPFTMDNGKPPNEDGRPLPNVPGMWQIPNDCIFFPGGRVTGFDYNLWFSKSWGKQEFVDALKYSLDKKYNGNRAPMKFGLHSNYYSDLAIEEMKIYDPASLARLTTTVVERTQALEEFVNYALTLPDVRIVSAKEALTWIRNPVPLVDVQYNVTTTAGSNGTINPLGLTKVEKGTDLLITVLPNPGFTPLSFTVSTDPAAQLDANNQYTLKSVQADAQINVTFQQAVTHTITATSSAGGSWDKEGAIVVVEGKSVTFTAVPLTGYKVSNVIVDNQSKGEITSYTFDNVTANHTIHVDFVEAPDEVVATYSLSGDWGTGFGANVVIKNLSTTKTVKTWKVVWTYPDGDRVTSLWNGQFTQTGNKVEVSNLSWNGTIGPGATTSFGLNGVPEGQADIPTDITVIVTY